MHLLRARQSDPAVNAAVDGHGFRRSRERHSQHILDMLRAGISMRTIRTHRLDDPRLVNEVRAVLVQAARERQSKARFRRSEDQRKQERLAGPIVRRVATADPHDGSVEGRSKTAMAVLDPLALREAIQAIRLRVCQNFYVREMRDPELTRRSKRCTFVPPHQVAMYLVKQVTGASL